MIVVHVLVGWLLLQPVLIAGWAIAMAGRRRTGGN